MPCPGVVSTSRDGTFELNRAKADSRTQLIGNIDRWDPIAFIIAAHGLGLAIAGETESPVLIAVLAGSLAMGRLAVVWTSPANPSGTGRLAMSAASVLVTYVVIVLDGGTESPFFFWVLLLLGWQALIFDRSRLLLLGGLNLGAYLTTIAVTGEWGVTSLARMALLVAFVFALWVGRTVQDQQASDIARLDEMVGTVVSDAPMAVSIFDADRDTVLYANQAAREMGINDIDSMARLVLDNGNAPHLTTLAAQVVGSGFESAPLRTYRPIGQTEGGYQIGYHARRGTAGRSLVVVYGMPSNA